MDGNRLTSKTIKCLPRQRYYLLKSVWDLCTCMSIIRFRNGFIPYQILWVFRPNLTVSSLKLIYQVGVRDILTNMHSTIFSCIRRDEALALFNVHNLHSSTTLTPCQLLDFLITIKLSVASLPLQTIVWIPTHCPFSGPQCLEGKERSPLTVH